MPRDTSRARARAQESARALRWAAARGKVSADNANYMCPVSIAEAEGAADEIDALMARVERLEALLLRSRLVLCIAESSGNDIAAAIRAAVDAALTGEEAGPRRLEWLWKRHLAEAQRVETLETVLRSARVCVADLRSLNANEGLRTDFQDDVLARVDAALTGERA